MNKCEELWRELKSNRLYEDEEEPDIKKHFSYSGGVSELEDRVKEIYSTNDKTCKLVCDTLSKEYDNLESVKIEGIILNGSFITSLHYVCRVTDKDGCDLVDPTGDQFNSDFNKEEMECWCYSYNEGLYLSNSHSPYKNKNLKDHQTIVEISENNSGLRAIWL